MEKQTSSPVFFRCFVFLLICIVGIRTGSPLAIVRSSIIYVSHTTGADDYTCGAKDSPCKTLKFSVDRLVPGGTLFLNGTDSKKHPYTCGPTNTTSVDMSLIIYNWYTQAYVACEIWFRRNPPGQTGAAPFPGSFSAPPLGNEVEPDPQLIVTLENLSFIQARGVRCYGVCYIEAFHLSFIRGGLSCDGVCSVYVSDSNFSNCNTALRLNGLFNSDRPI
ncbi:hypothetical protein OS493_017308 [Desmophyllum pertusum]|uniref:Uncharacterized protein n=1 Tax=Desmophyllum pertusum TaxID=174260 RepID=A0A9X0A185_9CNID|nr:hypothetical protein OS493_017308 [Desmophyllum pertusum]